MEEIEEWRQIPGFSGYEASNRGCVRSIPRTVTGYSCRGAEWTRRQGGTILAGNASRDGYLYVHLFLCGKRVRRAVHVLVASAFIGPRPCGLYTNHIDGNKRNNRRDNLEYCTPKENIAHACRTGLMNNSGERNGQAKATEQQIRSAHAMLLDGATYDLAASTNGIAAGLLRRVARGEKWVHLGLSVVPPRQRNAKAWLAP